jgi:hypothetical protein
VLLVAGASLALAAPALAAPPPTVVAFYAAPDGATGGTCDDEAHPCEVRWATIKADQDTNPDHLKVVRLASGDYDLGTANLHPSSPMAIIGVDGAPRPRIISRDNFALYMEDGVSARHLEIVAPGGYGIYAPGSSVSVDDVVSRAGRDACAFLGSNATIKNSVCAITDTAPESGVAALRVAAVFGDASATARNVTAIGTASPLRVGAEVDRSCGTCNAQLTLINSITKGAPTDVAVQAGDTGSGAAILDASYSNFDPGTADISAHQAQLLQNGGHNQSAPPVFAGACQGNYHEAAGSPTVDAGLATGGTDFDGDARSIGVTDIGADELVPPGPADACAPPTTTTTPASSGTPGGPTTVLGPVDVLAPAFTSASLTNTAFAVDRAGPAEALVSARRRARRGTAFKYTLSEPARVVFTIQRASPGRKVKGKCRKPARANRKKPKCTRYGLLGRFAQLGVAGANTKSWSGKIGKRNAKPGRYRATLVATDAAGNHSPPKRLSFRVVRR